MKTWILILMSYTSLFFAGCEDQQKTAVRAHESEEKAYWKARETDTVEGYREFLQKYPNTTGRSWVENTIRSMSQKELSIEEALPVRQNWRLNTSGLTGYEQEFRSAITQSMHEIGYRITTNPSDPIIYMRYSSETYAVGTPQKTNVKADNKNIVRVETPDLHYIQKYSIRVYAESDIFKTPFRDFHGEVNLESNKSKPDAMHVVWTELEPKIKANLIQLPHCSLSSQ